MEDFIEACESGNYERVKFFCDTCFDIIIEVGLIKEGFEKACNNGHFDIIKLFLDKGVQIDILDNISIRAACWYGNLEMAKYFKSIGANIHVYHNTCMLYAIKNGNVETMKWLYENGVDLPTQVDGKRAKKLDFFGACCAVIEDMKKLKWMHSLNIHSKNDYEKLFLYTFKNKNKEIPKWFYSIRDKSEIFEFPEFIEIQKLVQNEKEVYIMEVISKIHLAPLYKNRLFDRNLITIELWSYLFY